MTSAEAHLTGVGEVHDEADLLFASRRSPVLSQNGMVSSSQPLATAAGLRILQNGGNAADAAVAVAACLNVTEPCSTGIGGDAFALYYDATTKTVSCVQGNGRSPVGLTPELIQERGHKDALPFYSGLTVTVPGAAAAWVDIVERFGSLPLKEVLAPATELAEKGYPVSPITASHWARGVAQLQQGGPHAGDMLIHGRAPRPGEIMKMPRLANTFRLLAENGKKGFYEGPVAEATVKAVNAQGGVFTLDDLREHQTAFPEPIHTTYKGVQVWEVPPPTHGLAALIALNILEAQGGGPSLGDHSSVQHYHVLIETMRLAFADSLAYIADPLVVHCPIQELLSKKHGKERAALIDLKKAIHVAPSIQGGGSDTVYFCAVDGRGNACSMINSNFMGFGTGIIPEGCGFTLQNRGYGFSLDPKHPNCIGPKKRPYHTIIPGLATYAPTDGDESHAGELCGPFGVMGGFMQPQGHLQVIVNLLDHGMDPQAALDAPRFCIAGLPGVRHSAELIANSQCYLEDQPGAEEKAAKLREMGHEIKVLSSHDRASFGRGQIIIRDRKSGVLWAGSDPRADGCAMGW